MTHAGYVISGWVITFGVIGLYAFLLLRRGRAAAEQLPEDHRRWMTSDD